MYSVSDAFHAACKAPGRQFTAKAQFNGTTDLTANELLELTMNEVFDSSDGISIGSACSSHVKIRFIQPAIPVALNGGYVVPYSGLMVGSSYQYVPLGKFYVTDVSGKDGDQSVEITAYDGMSKLERTYTPTVTFPALISAVVADICMQCGVELDSSVVFPAYTIDVLSDGNCKQQIGWIAGLMGGNACCDRIGQLTFRWYAGINLIAGRDTQYSGGLERTTSTNFTVRSLTTGTKENTITVGSGSGISSMNPYMTQDIAAAVYNRIKNTTITPAKLKWRGDPSVECGDIIGAEDKSGAMLSVAIMEQELHIGGGFSAACSCYGKSDAAIVMDRRPSDVKIDKLYTGFAASLQEATKLITGQLGGYFRITQDADGFPTGWVIQDTPTVTPTTKMWIMSMGGLGFSADGGVTIRSIALTMDGAINANSITVGSLEMDRVDGLSAEFTATKAGILSQVAQTYSTKDDLSAAEDGAEKDTNDLRAQLRTMESSIMQTVEGVRTTVRDTYTTNADTAALKQQMESLVEQTASSLTILFNQAKDTADSASDSVGSLQAEIENYIRFSAAGIEIGENTSSYKMLLSATKLSFFSAGQDVAYISNNKLYISNLVVTTSANLVGLKISKRSSGGKIAIKYSQEVV